MNLRLSRWVSLIDTLHFGLLEIGAAYLLRGYRRALIDKEILRVAT